MPRIPRVTPAESTAHERIMASLAGTGSEPAMVEPLGDPEPTVVAEPTNAEIREWAADNWDGDVSASGPIPKAVREAYDAAHGA